MLAIAKIVDVQRTILVANASKFLYFGYCEGTKHIGYCGQNQKGSLNAAM